MRTTIVASGTAGLINVWILNQRHQAKVYDYNGHCGGHNNTWLVRTKADANKFLICFCSLGTRMPCVFVTAALHLLTERDDSNA